MIHAVLTVAPSDGFQIQFCDRTKNSAGKKVIFYKADQALHFAFSEGCFGLQSFVWKPIVSMNTL